MFISSMFSRCPNCGKFELPPGFVLVSSTFGPPSLFCLGEGQCANNKCVFCGHYVNPWHHSYNECAKMRTLCDLRDYPVLPLRYDEVLVEAEAILKRGREK